MFSAVTYEQWLDEYPDSPQCKTWQAELDRLTRVERVGLFDSLGVCGVSLDYTGSAVWSCADADLPVTVTGYLGIGADGRHYFSTTDGVCGVPGDELRPDKPPSSITGVLRTENEKREEKEALGGLKLDSAKGPAEGLVLDWFAVTIPTLSIARRDEVLSELRGLLPCVSTSYGGNGYTHGETFLDTGRILWHPDRLDMGVHVRLTSETLVLVNELLPGFHDAHCILDWFIVELGATVTRLDLALDTSVDIVTLAIDALNIGDVRTRARGFEPRQPKKMSRAGISLSGNGVTIGNRSSSTYVRLYDKSLEQGIDGPAWYRCEFEYKGDRAGAIVGLLLSGDYAAVVSAMLAHLDFKQPSLVDSNKSRWVTVGWWAKLLGTIVKQSLCLARVARTSIDKIGEWLDKQVGPSLALWWVSCERKGVDLNDWVMSFAPRWGPKHKLVLKTI